MASCSKSWPDFCNSALLSGPLCSVLTQTSTIAALIFVLCGSATMKFVLKACRCFVGNGGLFARCGKSNCCRLTVFLDEISSILINGHGGDNFRGCNSFWLS